jgi:hypothetical protein
LLSRAKWDVDGVRDDLRSYTADELGDDAAVLVVARHESGLRKILVGEGFGSKGLGVWRTGRRVRQLF